MNKQINKHEFQSSHVNKHTTNKARLEDKSPQWSRQAVDTRSRRDVKEWRSNKNIWFRSKGVATNLFSRCDWPPKIIKIWSAFK